MRSRLDTQLDHIKRDLVIMGGLCEEATRLAADVLVTQSQEITNRVFSLGQEIDEKEREIEAHCLRVLLQQQPVAHDLRQTSAALKMISDLGRIGAQAEDIAEIAHCLPACELRHHPELHKMAQSAARLVTKSVDAFVEGSLEAARAAIEIDDEVDASFVSIRNELIDVVRNQPNDAACALDILMITKYLERIGDHAVNVALWVEYSITGERIKG